MTDVNTFGALESMFGELNRAAGEFDDQQAVTAEEAISYFTRPGGYVDMLGDGDFKITHEPVTEVKNWSDPWPVTYGIDGSTTRSLEFNNGLIAVGSAAKVGVSGQTDNTHLADRTTTTLVAHLNDEDFEMRSVSEAGLDIADTVNADIFHFPASERISRIGDYIVGVSRTYAEGKHARNCASELDGPLFIDGPIYPSPAFGWMLFEQAGTGPTHMTDIWPEMVSAIVQNYVSTVEKLKKRDYPPIGIIKTGGSSSAINALEAKIDNIDADTKTPLPWTSDYQMFADALYTPEDRYGDRGSIISYTPWLLQKKEVAHGTPITPFENYDGVSLRFGDPDEYKRAFFYVRTPQTDNVFRVETPHIFARNKRMRERVQRKALVELAQQQKEPRAITFADNRARITKDDRDKFRQTVDALISIEDYNERRGYREYDEA